MAKAEVLQPFILSWEGGFANVPGDRGGATNKGVTLETYRIVFGKEKTMDDLKHLTDAEWLEIFRNYYWNKWRADKIENQAVANLLVDWYWCSGAYGIKIPQYMLGVAIDGIVGPRTLAALNGYKDQKLLFDKLWQERSDFLHRIAKGAQKKFLKGWINRLRSIKYDKLVCNGGNTVLIL